MRTARLVLIVCFALSGAPVTAADVVAPLPLKIKADVQEYTLETHDFLAEGHSSVVYGDVTLTADSISGNSATGNVKADGGVTFLSPNRKLTGKTFEYSFGSGKGFATDAYAESNGVYFHGAEMIADPERYVLKNSRFSTCDLAEPHYYLAAEEMNLQPDKRFVAKGVRLVFHGRTLLHIPRYSSRLSKGKGEAGFQAPAFGVGDGSGIYTGYSFDLGQDPVTGGKLDVRLSTKWLVQGALAYESIGGGPLFARIAYRQPYRGGRRSRPMVSRLPEFGVRFGPRSARMTEIDDSLGLSTLLIRPEDSLDDQPKISLSGEVGIGRFAEDPDFRSFNRADARAVCRLRPLDVGSGVLMSPGVFGRVSRYEGGDEYTDVGARLGVAKQLGKKSFVSMSYLKHSVAGDSPMDFDRVPMREEIASLIAFPIGSFGLELETRYDLGDHRLYDAEVTVKKTMHCLEPSITWRKRSGSISFNMAFVKL